MGYLYMHGMGVEKNLDKAVELFQKAAHEKGKREDDFVLLLPSCDDWWLSLLLPALC